MRLKGRERRHKRVRKKIIGTPERPRLCVFRSNRHIYAQIIDDTKGRVLCGVSSVKKPELKGNKTAIAAQVGRMIAQIALRRGIEAVSFDRAGYRYHGRIKALAEGAREAGLKF